MMIIIIDLVLFSWKELCLQDVGRAVQHSRKAPPNQPQPQVVKITCEFAIFEITICFRSSAVIYMRRAGLSWQTIQKITGHKKIDNLIKHYDTIMEAQGNIIGQFLLNSCSLVLQVLLM